MSCAGRFSGPGRLPSEEDYSNCSNNPRAACGLARPEQLAPGVYLVEAVSALDLEAREDFRPNDPPGSDADAWFSALDDRTIELGPATCIARVLGIHIGADGLWIQLACEGTAETSVVVHVTSATRVEEVLHRLKVDPPVGRPLEVLDMDGPHSTPAVARLGRTNAVGALPAPRNTH